MSLSGQRVPGTLLAPHLPAGGSQVLCLGSVGSKQVLTLAQ